MQELGAYQLGNCYNFCSRRSNHQFKAKEINMSEIATVVVNSKNQSLSLSGNKLKVGIVGATGMVGQQLIRMLKEHPWFEISKLAASAGSANKTYAQAVETRWFMDFLLPEKVGNIEVIDSQQIDKVVEGLDVVFCAVNLDKQAVLSLENELAARGVFVVSCNSAHRPDPLVPMMIPAANPEHLAALKFQRANRGYTTGGIIVKSNCSIQSYVIALTPLKAFGPKQIFIHSEQAISGAGKTFKTWPEMVDNVNPYIGGEEQKSEQEPLKIWGKVTEKGILSAQNPQIKAKCVRVAVSDGHTAYVRVQFEKQPSKEAILEAWKQHPFYLGLPSQAKAQIHYLEEVDRPQPRLDVMTENGMAVSIGQLETEENNWVRFTALAHNAILGAAGGAVLALELAVKEGYVYRRVASEALATRN
jgi:aspartate-semialdehyde dehydrogenase